MITTTKSRLLHLFTIPFLFCLLAGCASTTIQSPSGWFYSSTKDVGVDNFHLEATERLDGSRTTIVDFGGARGNATSVNDSYARILQAAMEAAFTAGLKAAPNG